MTEYVKDLERGYKVQKVFANEWEDTYGDVCDFKSEVEALHPGCKVLKGYVVMDVNAGLVPDGCNDWNNTIEEAITDYEEHVVPTFVKLPEDCYWFALNEEKCISIWFSPDEVNGDQFQMQLEERAEAGSMGSHCEVICDESYGTRNLSFEALCETLHEVCEDAGLTAEKNVDAVVKELGKKIFENYGLEVPGLEKVGKKPYRIAITETYVKEVEVYAEDEQSAMQLAEDLCRDGVIEFDYDNFADRNTECRGIARQIDLELQEVYGEAEYIDLLNKKIDCEISELNELNEELALTKGMLDKIEVSVEKPSLDVRISEVKEKQMDGTAEKTKQKDKELDL